MKSNGNKKYCPSCEQTKDVSSFGNDNARIDGKKVYCKKCRKDKGKRYYYANLNESRHNCKLRMRKYRQNHPEKKEESRKAAKEWYQENKNRATIRRKRWRKTFFGRMSVMKMNQKRKSRISNSIVDLSNDDIEFLLALQLNECAKCGKEFTIEYNKRFTLDHILPLSLGGDLVLENVQLLCRSCNSSKGDNVIMYRPNINFKCLSFI